MTAQTKSHLLYENLDTTFVNLWSLLRNLTQRRFIGRVHVELTDYSADIFMTGSSAPVVREVDRAAGTGNLEEAALHRLVLRARETPGSISVFEGEDEAKAPAMASQSKETSGEVSYADAQQQAAASSIDYFLSQSNEPAGTKRPLPNATFPVSPNQLASPETPRSPVLDSATVVAIAGEVIAAVERAVTSSGGDFGALFREMRVELADDYGFLDPHSPVFEYANGVATIKGQVARNILVTGLSEALRQLANKVAVGERERRVRERLAVELLAVARNRRHVLDHSGFRPQLDRIAGTKVI